MSRRADDAIVIGGGLQGCSVALHLARAGRRVTILEKNLCGRHASGVNAGGIRMLMREPAEYPLSLRAMELWEHLPDLLGKKAAAEAGFIGGVGQIALALDEAELAWCEARAAQMRAAGLGQEELIGTDELRRLLPHVAAGALGGLVSRRDGHGNPACTARAFRGAAEAAGARVVEGCRVLGLAPSSAGWRVETSARAYEAGMVINCGGAWGAELATMVGESLPVEVLALSMMVTARVKPFLAPVVIGVDRPLSFKQSELGTLVIGGGILGRPAPEADTSFTVMDRMTRSAAAVIEAFPRLASVPVLRSWTGLEAKTPDGMPYIGPSCDHADLWHVFGFSGHGFQLSPAVGEAVTQSLLSGRIDPLIAPFDPYRSRRAAA